MEKEDVGVSSVHGCGWQDWPGHVGPSQYSRHLRRTKSAIDTSVFQETHVATAVTGRKTP